MTRQKRVRHEQDKCDTMRKVWLECDVNDTIATRVKNFDFDNDTSENIFSYPKISYIANVRLSLITRRRTISFSELLFRNASFSCQNAFEKCTSKSELCNGKAYFKKLYSRLELQMPLHVPAQLRLITQPRILCKTNNYFFAKNFWKLGKMNARFWKNI